MLHCQDRIVFNLACFNNSLLVSIKGQFLLKIGDTTTLRLRHFVPDISDLFNKLLLHTRISYALTDIPSFNTLIGSDGMTLISESLSIKI